MLILGFIVLLLVANGTPLVLAYLLDPHYSSRIDGGHRLTDGNPVFGPSKTWRGLLGACVLTSMVAPAVGYSVLAGLSIALCAMLGDLISSFVKRRQGLASSTFVLGIDQIPETLLPALIVGIPVVGFGTLEIAFVVGAFLVLELMSSRPLHRLGIRKQRT